MKISKIIEQIHKDSHLTDWRAEKEVAEFLSSLVRMTESKSILEIGTYVGYSTLHLLDSIPKNGMVYTIDIKNYSKKYFVQLDDDYKKKLVFFQGTSRQFKLKFNKKIFFDLIFIDADHDFIPSLDDFYCTLFCSKEGTVFVFHDTLSENFHEVYMVISLLKKINFLFFNKFFEIISLNTPLYSDGTMSGISIVKIRTNQVLLPILILKFYLTIYRKLFF